MTTAHRRSPSTLVRSTGRDYHGLPLEPALATVEGGARQYGIAPAPAPRVRVAAQRAAHRVRAPTALDWLRIYAGHLERHARQIEGDVAAWERRAGAR